MVSRPPRCPWWPSSTWVDRSTTLKGDAERNLPTDEAWGFVMQQVSATRSELLARRARIKLAAQGRDLLKERRSALVHEFNRLGASALASIDALDRDAADAGRLLGMSVAAHGPDQVE